MHKMTDDPSPTPRSQPSSTLQAGATTRRTLLAGGLGAVGAWLAGAISGPAGARAGSDGDVVLGAANTSGSTTVVTVGTNDVSSLWGNATGNGVTVGVRGDTSSNTGRGVWGRAVDSGTGVRGDAGTGGVGTEGYAGAGGVGVYGTGGGSGVTGLGGSLGVQGISGTGSGVRGYTQSGIAVEAVVDTGGTGIGIGVTSTSGKGIVVTSATNRAIDARSESGYGVYGKSDTDDGIHGVGPIGVGVRGESSAGTGVLGVSTSGIAVGGSTAATDQPAVYGRSHGNATGVLAYSGPAGSPLPATKPGTGLYAESTVDAASRGVWGRSEDGRGVFGEATTGVGVFGSATKGYALRTNGRVRADKVSGMAIIPAGRTSVTVSPGVGVSSAAFVLLTPRADIGARRVWYSTNATADTVTIRMSSARTKSTPIGWLLLG